MNIREMHYDYLRKLNLVDSRKFAGLVVPEIDWVLNEANELLPKMIANPRDYRVAGFESSQRTIDDIKSLVVNQKPADYGVPQVFDDKSFILPFPTDYWFYVRGKALADSSKCTGIPIRLVQIQSTDEDDLSPFDRSDFIWRESTIRFIEGGIRIFTDGTYSIKKVGLDYLKKPKRIHNAQDWGPGNGQYVTLDDVTLTGRQDSDLPVTLHGSIVDLAVFLTVTDLNPSYQVKQAKFKLSTQ